ncbi:MAG: CHAT domain-containing protein [Proteobacteria bacterium]|nr:CHAT domain-containing protein [Pseudomonadota bacterium]
MHALASVEAKTGRLRDAVRHVRQAIKLSDRKHRELTWTLKLANWLLNAGNIEGSQGTIEQAEALMEDIRNGTKPRQRRAWEQRGAGWQATIIRLKARILDRRGKYAEAGTMLKSAYDKMVTAIDSKDGLARISHRLLEILQGNYGMVLLRQGRLIEAEIEIRSALISALRRTGRYGPEVANYTSNLASVMAAQGRAGDAEALARESIEITQNIGAQEDSQLMRKIRLRLASSLAAQRRWPEVLVQFDAIGAAGTAGTKQVSRNLLYAKALINAGRAAEATTVAERAVRRASKTVGEKHYNTVLARGVLGIALARMGRTSEALGEFSRALPILLSRSRRTDGEEGGRTMRDRQLGWILENYIATLADSGGTANGGKRGYEAARVAFQVANAARGQAVHSALSANAARTAARDPNLADIARREQDALKQIGALNGLYAEAVSVPTDQQDRPAISDLKKRIDSLRDARAALMKEIEKRFPDYAALINPKPATVAQAQRVLRPGEALIATYVGEKATYVWAVSKTGEPAFAVAPLGRKAIAAAVKRLRRALDPQAGSLGEIPAFDTVAAYRLFKALLAPVAAGWKESKSLLVVAHGALGQLPFSVLVTSPAKPGAEKAPMFSNYRGVPFLVRSHAVTVLPSVTALATLRASPPSSSKRRAFAGFGDPVFDEEQLTIATAAGMTQSAALTSQDILKVRGLPVRLRAAPKLDGVSSTDLANLPRLPDTADEVRSIALEMHADLTRDVFTGRNASEGQVKTMKLSGYKVIAFATHGLVPGDLNGLTQPALALSSPKVVGGEDDGLLTMGEILGLKLDADWVVLSACNTASGNGAGAEAISGLGRAFFYAGTRALLVSNWPVETTSAKSLTTDVFRRQSRDAALDRAEALRQSMLGLIDGPGLRDAKGDTVFSYAHPIFWAPFSLVGDGGG